MTAKQYLGDLIGGALLLRESRLIAVLLLKQPDQEEWKRQIEDNNLLQKGSLASGKRFASTIRKRIEPLGQDFWQALLDADDDTAVQLMLLAILLNSPILSDFMRIELQEAQRLFQERLDADVWMRFYQERCRVIPELANFSETSVKKIGNNAIKILTDAGYLQSARSKALQNVFVLPDTRVWAQRLGDANLIEVLECSR